MSWKITTQKITTLKITTLKISPLTILSAIGLMCLSDRAWCCTQQGEIHGMGPIASPKTDGSTEGGWVVQIPSGSSDYFNVRYDATGSTTFSGVSVAVYDLGATNTYPSVGIYNANLGLDPSGNTPNLVSPVATANSPPIIGGQPNDWQDVALSGSGSGTLHVAIQFSPGDSGLLAVGGDSDSSERGGNGSPGNPDPFDASSFTTNGYSTDALGPFASCDWGLSPITPPAQFFSGSNGILALSVDNAQLTGDFAMARVIAGDDIGVALFAPKFANPSVWLLFISFLGTPIIPAGPVLSTLDGGTHRYFRVGGSWPIGAGSLTLNFVAITGSPGVPGSIGITNEVTVSSLADPNFGWGAWDDCSYESGWVVGIPSLSSEYFTVAYGNAPGSVNANLHVAFMDFGGSVSSFPSSGFAPPNLGLDASGLTPDLSNTYTSFTFPFPSLTFVSTCSQMVTKSTGSAFNPSGGVNSFIQFPPGDPGLIGIGGDTNGSPVPTNNGWTLNGFSTPANPFGVNWGLRAD